MDGLGTGVRGGVGDVWALDWIMVDDQDESRGKMGFSFLSPPIPTGPSCLLTSTMPG